MGYNGQLKLATALKFTHNIICSVEITEKDILIDFSIEYSVIAEVLSER